MSNNNLLKTELVEYLKEVELDEERVLANLVFDPGVIGQQLLENHFLLKILKARKPIESCLEQYLK